MPVISTMVPGSIGRWRFGPEAVEAHLDEAEAGANQPGGFRETWQVLHHFAACANEVPMIVAARDDRLRNVQCSGRFSVFEHAENGILQDLPAVHLLHRADRIDPIAESGRAWLRGLHIDRPVHPPGGIQVQKKAAALACQRHPSLHSGGFTFFDPGPREKSLESADRERLEAAGKGFPVDRHLRQGWDI